MSAPRFRLELATRAQRDIKSIRAYSVSHWGEEQADLYLAAIAQGFETLCIHPEIGRAHEDWQPKGVRSYQVREHLIVYRLKGEVVNVLRVVHRKRDVSRLFGRSLGDDIGVERRPDHDAPAGSGVERTSVRTSAITRAVSRSICSGV